VLCVAGVISVNKTAFQVALQGSWAEQLQLLQQQQQLLLLCLP
jgi:hypothetical protein